jgi:hypothetical protein
MPTGPPFSVSIVLTIELTMSLLIKRLGRPLPPHQAGKDTIIIAQGLIRIRVVRVVGTEVTLAIDSEDHSIEIQRGETVLPRANQSA